MPYTLRDAEREVGDSKDWAVGLEASIKKWEQRVRGDLASYSKIARCGVCFVAANRGINCIHDTCLTDSICKGGQFTIHTPGGILQALKNLRKELDPMNCSKSCANFKPKNESPFPEGLKTEDLKVGMVVRKGNVYDGYIYTILERPGDRRALVLSALPNHTPKETRIWLDSYGCQPYQNGDWNSWNWLREVK